MSSNAPPPPPPWTPPSRRPPRAWLFLVGGLAAYLVFRLLSGSFVGHPGAPPRSGRLSGPPSESRPVVARGDLSAEEKAMIALFRQSSPSVVFITSLARRRSAWMNVMEIPQGAGSGFIWDRDGHIVTNFHVIQDADAARVTLADQSEWKAALVGTSPDRDLAVLRIAASKEKLPPLLIGTSRHLQVGQRVFAIGNPFGLDQSLTTGVVSALGRSILSVTGRRIENVIQTDAAINPGNSGGPLLDSAGRLIGVNTQIASTSGSSAGIGFAVPVDTVNQVVPQLIGHGRIIRPQLGIQPASDSIQQRLGIEGVLILAVTEGAGAEKAGLRGTGRAEDGSLVLGDIIQAVDEKKIKDLDDLFGALESHKVGEKVNVRVLRDGKPLTVNVELQPSL